MRPGVRHMAQEKLFRKTVAGPHVARSKKHALPLHNQKKATDFIKNSLFLIANYVGPAADLPLTLVAQLRSLNFS
jgi:hypothetical protein